MLLSACTQRPEFSILSNKGTDQAVLDQMRAHGADLTKPTDIVFYLYIPAKSDADASASWLRRKGFRSETQPPLGKLDDGTTERRWSVVSHLTAVPALVTIQSAGSKMRILAQRYHGEYDGWEAAVQ